MTGGMAYVYDADEAFERAVNPDSVVWQRIVCEHYDEELRDLVREHAAQTGSEFAKTLLENWDAERGRFWQVVPKEMLGRLAVPVADAAE